MTKIPLLSVSNFTLKRGERILAKEISFTLFPGEMAVLKGPNGSGKTTFLRCLAGIPELPLGIQKERGISQSYVGHTNALKTHLTVRQNLIYQTRATCEDFMESGGISHLLDREVRTLSMGQRRQVALARLSLSRAILWLMDEPVTHLDEKANSDFWLSLHSHLVKGGAAILSTHTQTVPLTMPTKEIFLHG